MKYTTSIQIDNEIMGKIKAKGMTLSGALLQGLEAMDKLLLANAELMHREKNILQMQAKITLMSNKLYELGIKVDELETKNKDDPKCSEVSQQEKPTL